MKRDKELIINIPSELEKDFRIFTVIHGGSICNTSRQENELEILKNRCWVFVKKINDFTLCECCNIECDHRINKDDKINKKNNERREETI